MLELVDDLYFSDEPPHSIIEKKTAELQKELFAKNAYEAEKILRSPGACGSHMGKLARSHPDRISLRRIQGYAIWTIKPPLQTNKEKE